MLALRAGIHFNTKVTKKAQRTQGLNLSIDNFAALGDFCVFSEDSVLKKEFRSQNSVRYSCLLTVGIFDLSRTFKKNSGVRIPEVVVSH